MIKISPKPVKGKKIYSLTQSKKPETLISFSLMKPNAKTDSPRI